MVDFDKLIRTLDNLKIPQNMLSRGHIVINEFLKPIKILFEQKAVPKDPWSDEQIRFLLYLLSNMDTDKDPGASRVGEREARIASKIQLETSAGFCHGIGRSGFLTAPQPKAPGGSIMYELANSLARNFFKKSGLPNIKDAVVLPLCTGMSLSLCLGALRPFNSPGSPILKNNILIPRIDHKSLMKAVELMGIEKKIIEGKKEGDAVRIPMEDIRREYDETCFAIVSLTSFFPPREHDDLKEISKFAKEKELVHIIINAYGVQSPDWMGLIRSAIDAGRVDIIIQSTDKNFLTPVGGAVAVSPSKDVIQKVSQAYAGRASATPIVNFMISMLSLGFSGYKNLLEAQEQNRTLLEEKLKVFAGKIGERVLDVFNPVAVAMSLESLEKEKLAALGGILYNLRVTGPRVFDPSEKKFGTCCSDYSTPYIVMNAAIGATSEDINTAIMRLEKAFIQVIG